MRVYNPVYWFVNPLFRIVCFFSSFYDDSSVYVLYTPARQTVSISPFKLLHLAYNGLVLFRLVCFRR
jgi:hypothetical protein